MKYLLVTAIIDYADEFNCEMFGIFTDEQWKSLCDKTKKFFNKFEEGLDGEETDETYSESGEVEAYFGTNEALIFSDYKSWLKNFDKKEITKEQYDFLNKNFGKTWGTGSEAFFIGIRNEDDGALEIEY